MAMFARKSCLFWVCTVPAFLLSMQGNAVADLMAYYTFEKTSGGTLVDSSGRGRNGVVTARATPAKAPGIIGTSRFGLDAGAGHGKVVDGGRLFDVAGVKRPFTIAMWFQAPSFGGSQRNYLVHTGRGAGKLFRIVTIRDSGGNRISIGNGRTATVFNANKVGNGFSPNTWYHLTAAYNGSDAIAVYVNGVLLPPADGNIGPWTTTPTATDFYICTRPNGGDSSFNGIVRDLGIWNEVLSDEKIALINGLGRFSGVGLSDASISNVLRVFGAKGGTAAAGNQTWGYKSRLGSTIIGATGGAVAGGDAYVVLDGSGAGVRIVIPEPATTRLLTHGVSETQRGRSFSLPPRP